MQLTFDSVQEVEKFYHDHLARLATFRDVNDGVDVKAVIHELISLSQEEHRSSHKLRIIKLMHSLTNMTLHTSKSLVDEAWDA